MAGSRRCCKATISDPAKNWKPRCTAMSGSTTKQLSQSVLGSKSPLQAMKDWHKLKPKLFKKQLY